MAACHLLEGKNRAPKTAKEARALIGVRVEYLRNQDIDRSGRGYFFPRKGAVEDVNGKNLAIDGDWIAFSRLRELVVLEGED